MLGLQQIRRAVWKPHASSAAASPLYTPREWIASDVVLNKDGGLLMVAELQGVEREGLDPDEVDAAQRVFGAAFRSLGYKVECSQHRMKLRATDGGWKFHDYIAFTLQPQPASEGLRRFLNPDRLSEKRTRLRLQAELDERMAELRTLTQGFAALCSPLIKVRFLERDEAMLALWLIANFDPSKLDEMRDLLRLPPDKFLASVPIAVYRRHLEIGKYHVEILHLREAPPETHADIFWDLLEARFNYCLAVNMAGVEPLEIQRLLGRRMTELHFKRWSLLGGLVAGKNASLDEVRQDFSAKAMQDDIGALQTEAVANETPVLQMSLFLTIFDEDPEEVARASAACSRIFSKHGAQLVPESWGLIPARFASLPGGSVYDLRRIYLTLPNCVDFSLVFHPAGE